MSVDEIFVEELYVDEMSVDKMSMNVIYVDKTSADKMSVGEMSVDEIHAVKFYVNKMSVDTMSVAETSLDEMFVDKISWRLLFHSGVFLKNFQIVFLQFSPLPSIPSPCYISTRADILKTFQENLNIIFFRGEPYPGDAISLKTVP
jgi:hypothetical protein